jgi:hypothetical protein
MWSLLLLLLLSLAECLSGRAMAEEEKDNLFF